VTATDLEISLRRTLVPLIAGLVVARAARVGLDIPEDALVGVLEGVVIGLYYTVVRLVETRLPRAGILLGAAQQPRYEDEALTVDDGEDDAA